MIRIMALDIAKRFPDIETLISYRDTSVHKGTIYKASGWEVMAHSAGYDWELHGKKQRRYPRGKPQSLAPKIKMAKRIETQVDDHQGHCSGGYGGGIGGGR